MKNYCSVLLPLQSVDPFLQSFQKGCGVSTVHLGVMKLKGHCQACPEKGPFIFSPDHKGVIEYTAVHTHCTVNAVLGQGGGADDHAVLQIVVLTAFSHLGGKCQILCTNLPSVSKLDTDCIHGGYTA